VIVEIVLEETYPCQCFDKNTHVFTPFTEELRADLISGSPIA
jgi:hypothetical protein